MTQVEGESRILNNYIVVPPGPRTDWSINDFELLHKLGGGNYGAVYLAAVRNCNFIVAIKKLSIKKLA